MSLEKKTVAEYIRDPMKRKWRLRKYMEPIPNAMPSTLILEPEKAKSLVRKYHPKLADMTGNPAQSVTQKLSISEDATSVTTADGVNASDIQITNQMICEGLWKGIIKIEVNDSDELICKIGSYWFTFDTFWHDHYTNLTIYLIHTDMIELVVNIFNVIEEIKDTNEYDYYYWYLKENLKG